MRSNKHYKDRGQLGRLKSLEANVLEADGRAHCALDVLRHLAAVEDNRPEDVAESLDGALPTGAVIRDGVLQEEILAALSNANAKKKTKLVLQAQ